jgi:hypothetical protein
MEQLLDSIAERTLVSVDFSGNDSIRMDFEGNILVLYQWPIAGNTDAVEIKEDDPGYRDLLNGLVNDVVQSVSFSEGVSLTISFSKVKIHLPLTEDEESFYFKSKKGDWMAA